MKTAEWADAFDSAVTVCDTDGKILYMNEQSAKTFANRGGKNLVGKSLYECHSEASQEKIKELIRTASSNVYTIEKQGQKKLILQSPWFENGKCKGLVEISIKLPSDVPHFVRKSPS